MTSTVTGHKPSLPSPWFCQARYFMSQAFSFVLSEFNMSSAATGRDIPAPKRKRQNAGVVDDDVFRKPRGSDGCFELVSDCIKKPHASGVLLSRCGVSELVLKHSALLYWRSHISCDGGGNSSSIPLWSNGGGSQAAAQGHDQTPCLVITTTEACHW